MPRTASFSALALRPAPPGMALSTWLHEELRSAVMDGRLKPGARLPSTRSLAGQYGVARGTSVAAFAQLQAEGYLAGSPGSGTFVAAHLPDRFFQPLAIKASRNKEPAVEPPLSKWGARVQSPFPHRAARDPGHAFEPFLPSLDLFPTALWGRLAGRRLRQATPRLLGVGDPLGYAPLREAVAAYLGSARGVKCSPDQVAIVSGTQQSLELVSRLAIDPGNQAWVEDPGYIGAIGALKSAGARIVAVPVDDEGIDVRAGQRKAPAARLAYVTPAHQFPLGTSLSLERRLALIQWARKAGAWIFEDDYDSEYRFTGRPLAALQSLGAEDCVIFAGSFNKMLFPTLRLGYVVLPQRLVEPFAHARGLSDRFEPILDQAVLADFFIEGHFGQHIRRMREAYAERLSVLLEAAAGPLAGLIDVSRIQAGMQAAAFLSASCPDIAAAKAAAAQQVEVQPLSVFQLRRTDINGLLLGFANCTPAVIRQGARRLAKALASMKP